MEYHRGQLDMEDYPYVLVRKWMPGAPRWVEAGFRAIPDQEIGGPAAITLDEEAKPRAAQVPKARPRNPRGRAEQSPGPRRRITTLDFSTGCVAMQQENRDWLDVRDPAGVIRRLMLVSTAESPPKLNECKEAAPATELTLERAASAPTRMLGRENARYINVGFRCVKALWPVTSPPQEALKAPAHF
jgi:hypothetical protein